jgi:putative ABC transport system substrate-binding protein
LVDRFCGGAKSAYFQVKQPTKLDLIVNLIVPKALGLEAPPTLLARADEVIE